MSAICPECGCELWTDGTTSECPACIVTNLEEKLEEATEYLKIMVEEYSTRYLWDKDLQKEMKNWLKEHLGKYNK